MTLCVLWGSRSSAFALTCDSGYRNAPSLVMCCEACVLSNTSSCTHTSAVSNRHAETETNAASRDLKGANAHRSLRTLESANHLAHASTHRAYTHTHTPCGLTKSNSAKQPEYYARISASRMNHQLSVGVLALACVGAHDPVMARCAWYADEEV